MTRLTFIFITIALTACTVCKKTVGWHRLELKKEDLVCGCGDLKNDTLLGHKIWQAEGGHAQYLVGAVLTDPGKKGLYQYVKTGSGIRGNTFFYYNGGGIRLLDLKNIDAIADSLRGLGLNPGKVDKKIAETKKSMSRPVVNTTDSF